MEKFSLKWNDFSSNVQKSFQNLRKEEDFFDVTLVGDDCKHVTAHKLVLASSSEYFKMVFSKNKKYFQSNAMICLEGLSQNDLNNVLDYIYNGELQIYQHDLDRFLGIAERLKLEGLIGGNQNMDEDDNKTENIVEENNVKPDCTLLESTGLNKKQNNVKIATADKPIISVQSSDIHSLEELDQKVEKSYSKDSNGLYACHYCGKSLKHRGAIKEHVETHFEGLSFPCTFCDVTLRSRNSFRLHNKRQHYSL